MENPLKSLLPIEDRPDGTYLKISRDDKERMPLESLLQAIDASMVLNYEAAKIIDVWNRSRGVFEKIGPAFEFYNPALDKYVNVEVTPLKASMAVNSACIADGLKPNEKTLSYCLTRKGIKFGILTETIREFLKTSTYDTHITIAEGKPPVNGENGKIHYEVNVNPDKKPKVLADGSVDFRDIQTYTQVAKGQVIAKRLPPTTGTPGMSVTGEQIPATPGQEYSLVIGKNLIISDDHNYLIAKISGLVYEDHGMLSINEKLNIPNDVDFNTGNIKFSGGVTISGNVKPGFTVEADDDIEIHGDVEAATVRSRNGTVIIHRGIISNAVIFGKKGVKVAFIQSASATTEGELEVDHFCLHSTCVCDSFVCHDNSGGFIGGQMQAYTSVKVTNTGNEKDVVTKIDIVDKEKAGLETKLMDLEKLQMKLNEEINPIKKQLASKAAIFKKAGETVTERHKEELKKWVNAYNAVNMKLEYVSKNITQIKEKLVKPSVTSGEIVVTRDVFPGTMLSLYGNNKVIRVALSNKRFILKNQMIEVL